MNRLLACGAALPLLVACGAGSDSLVGVQDEELTQVISQVRPGQALRMSGRTLPVPSAKYPTIASALAVAQPGERVRVAAGTYAECLNLVDGVTLEGQVVSGEPAATLDGAGCVSTQTCTGVVCAGADIVLGAELRGFRIMNAPSNGIDVRDARGVRVTDVVVEAPGLRGILGTAANGLYVRHCRVAGPLALRGGITLLNGSTAWVRELVVEDAGHGIRGDRSTFVVEHSTFARTGAGVMLVRGAQGAVIRSEIRASTAQGVVVQPGGFYGDPQAAPSRVWLLDNVIEGNGSGILIQGLGASGNGFRNRIRGNGWGVYLTAGGEYVGEADVAAGNSEHAFIIAGCGLLCANVGCSAQVVVLEQSRAWLHGAMIEENGAQGVVAICGGRVDLRHSVSIGNGNGAVAIANAELNEEIVTAPSTITAHRTVFASNVEWGAIAYDSFMELGTLSEPGWNSFLSNGMGSIANVSSNPVPAQWNWFGTTDRDGIAASIGGYGVEFEPFLLHAP